MLWWEGSGRGGARKWGRGGRGRHWTLRWGFRQDNTKGLTVDLWEEGAEGFHQGQSDKGDVISLRTPQEQTQDKGTILCC